jgi:capsular polysaccharide biosynthesis protein
MCEVLPRLVVAQSVWGMPSPTTYNVLLPKSSTAFMLQSLSALGITSTIEYRHKLSVARAPLLFVTWRAQSIFPDKTVGFSLAHPHALQMLRSRLLEHLRLTRHQQQRPSIVVASRGNSTEMRHFDEDALIRSLAAAFPDHDILTANASQPLFDNMALFAAAAAVVGAHGGALANIVACPPFTPIVEIGFQSEASWHYEHVASALQLRYVRALAAADPLHRSVGAATIFCNISAVVSHVQQLLLSAPATFHAEL